MTDKEMLVALITIKRNIYSNPIKEYINKLITTIKDCKQIDDNSNN